MRCGFWHSPSWAVNLERHWAPTSSSPISGKPCRTTPIMYGTDAALTLRLYLFGCLHMNLCTSERTATNPLDMRCSSIWPFSLWMMLHRILFGATKIGRGVFNGLARPTRSNLNSPPALASLWHPVATGWRTLCPTCTGGRLCAMPRCWMDVQWMRPRAACPSILRQANLLGTAN